MLCKPDSKHPFSLLSHEERSGIAPASLSTEQGQLSFQKWAHRLVSPPTHQQKLVDLFPVEICVVSQGQGDSAAPKSRPPRRDAIWPCSPCPRQKPPVPTCFDNTVRHPDGAPSCRPSATVQTFSWRWLSRFIPKTEATSEVFRQFFGTFDQVIPDFSDPTCNLSKEGRESLKGWKTRLQTSYLYLLHPVSRYSFVLTSVFPNTYHKTITLGSRNIYF